MAINILVIDDDRKIAERLMRNLQRADKEGILGEIKVDDSIIKLDTVENYDISHLGASFDVALIDYQLSSTFTGILVSAWISLHLQIPRLTLTTAAYPGNPAYFNGFVLKDEITDSPEIVLQRIADCVDNYNAELWLAKQHEELISEYQRILDDDGVINQEELKSIEHLLDRFEKIIDAHQEERIKKVALYERSKDVFVKKQQENEERLSTLYDTLNRYLEEMKNG